MRKALYAGSFDPITLGHLDIIEKALTMFDQVHIGIGRNPKKSGLFTPLERGVLISDSLSEHFGKDWPDTLSYGSYDGSLDDAARRIGATHIVRGLRQVSDFNDEFVLHGAMRVIAPDLQMVHIICDSKYLHVSSSTARELASLGKRTDWLVTPNVSDQLAKRIEEAKGLSR